MADDKLVKPPDDSGPKGVTTTGGTVKISGKSRLQSAMAQAPTVSPEESFKIAAEAASSSTIDKQNDPLTAQNRIAIMADVSGSMSERAGASRKIDHLKAALGGFTNQVNFDTTSVAIYTFPFQRDYTYEDEEGQHSMGARGVRHKLSRDKFLIDITIQGLNASGGTPMDDTMELVLGELPLTRGIIISDGEADSYEAAVAQAHQFAKSETIIDTVHIGDSSSGEKLLEEIAKITGGIYIKFTNVGNFAKSFAFLTPEGRATLMLSAGPNATLEQKAAAARMLGAKEIK